MNDTAADTVALMLASALLGGMGTLAVLNHIRQEEEGRKSLRSAIEWHGNELARIERTVTIEMRELNNAAIRTLEEVRRDLNLLESNLRNHSHTSPTS